MANTITRPPISPDAASRVSALIPELYRLVSQLEEAVPGRSFTPDGHMLGSIGEVLAAARYALTLTTASTREVDAIAPDGREVEIKATGGNREIAMRGEPKHLLVLKLEKDGTATTIYNGPGSPVWAKCGKQSGRNGQRSITLFQLRKLQALVPEAERLPEVIDMNRETLKGSPLILATGGGLPPDPNEPKDLEGWCAYHGIPITDGGAAG